MKSKDRNRNFKFNKMNIDLTHLSERKVGQRQTEKTIYHNPRTNLFGFGGDGIGFVKYVKSRGGIQKRQNGFTKWYHGSSNTLVEAVRNIRKWYGLNVSPTGWNKYRVKYRSLETNELVKALYNEINK
jgi:hypothetical protein